MIKDKKLQYPLILITYTALLALAIFRVNEIGGFFSLTLTALNPFFVGFAIAFVLTGPCVFFETWLSRWMPTQKKLACGLAVFLSYVSVFAFFVGVVSIVIPKLMESVSIFADSIKVYTANLQEWLMSFADATDNEVIADMSLDLSSFFSSFSTYLQKALETALSTMSVAASQVIAVTGDLVSVLVNFVVALVFSVYMLADRKNLLRQCRRVLYVYVPVSVADKIVFVIRMSATTFSKFVAGQILEAFILGSLCAVGMIFIQADYALLIGIIVGVSALVPVAGGYVGGGLSFVLLFMVSPMQAIVFMVFLLILQQFEGNVIYPRVVGNSLGLPGLWVVFAVIVGGNMFGLFGVLVSVPCVSVLYALLRLDIERREGLQKKTKKLEAKDK